MLWAPEQLRLLDLMILPAAMTQAYFDACLTASDAHDHHELIYVTRGSYTAYLQDSTHVLGPGTAMFYPKACAHRNIPATGSECYCLQWQAPLPAPQWPRPIVDSTGRLDMLLNWLWQIDHAQHALQHSLLYTICCACDESADSQADPRLAKLRAYMSKNMHRHIRMPELSELVDLPSNALRRLCKQGFGESPMHYFRRLRVDKAIQLLMHTAHDLDHIANQVGATDKSHLSRWLKAYTGQTSSSFRTTFRSASRP